MEHMQRIERQLGIMIYLRDEGLTFEESLRTLRLVLGGADLPDAIATATDTKRLCSKAQFREV